MIPFRIQRGRGIKDIVCKCGSRDIKQISGRLNEQTQSWDYYDRKNNFVISIPIKSQEHEQ